MKVILLISFSTQPAEYQNQEQPLFTWTNPKGEMIGIWDKEWGDILLKALAENYPEYECEVWQPELRADKIYSAQLRERLIHRKFPAVKKKRWKRNYVMNEIFSQEIVEYVKKHDDGNTVFILPAKVFSRWLWVIFGSIKRSRVLFYNFLNSGLLLPNETKPRHLGKRVNNCLMNREKSLWMKRTLNLLTSSDNPEALARLSQLYPDLRLFYFKMGMDFDFWYPVMPKKTARESLHIPNEKFVIILSQRLVPEYQVDKFIEVLARLKQKHDFICYISGHGSREYEEYLSGLISNLGLAGRAILIGFVSDEDLREYLIAADLFVTVPLRFAGSGGALKASAIGTPVMHVKSGSSYEFLKEHGAGEFVDPTDYQGWANKLEQIIEGSEVRTVARETLINYYSWQSTADELHQALINLR